MSNKKAVWTVGDIKCPFYVRHRRDERSLICEGYEKGGYLQSWFKNKTDREERLGRYCVGRYELCPIYKTLMETKYGEGES